MDINTSLFIEHFNHNIKVQDVVLYPVVNRDLNFKFDSNTNLGEVCASIKSVNQSIMQDVFPVDIYQSKQENNKKNVLFKLSFQSVKKTLEKIAPQKPKKFVISDFPTSLPIPGSFGLYV